MAPKIGFIGILRDELDRDTTGTLRWVADLGFDGMEGAASLAEKLGLPVAETKAMLDAIGLEVPVQGGIKFGQTDGEIRAAVAKAKAIGASYVVDYLAPFNNRDEILRYADFSARAGRICGDEGIGLLYHNHNHEMSMIDGERGIEIFLDNTDPSLVNVELDVGWVAFGGGNPVELIETYPGRFPVLHMKDFESLMPDAKDTGAARNAATFAEVGDGVVDMQGVVAAAKKAGIAWLIIEQDRMNKLSPKESLERSYRNLKPMIA
jgi:sugar phosphate isomerase/epimerase